MAPLGSYVENMGILSMPAAAPNLRFAVVSLNFGTRADIGQAYGLVLRHWEQQVLVNGIEGEITDDVFVQTDQPFQLFV